MTALSAAALRTGPRSLGAARVVRLTAFAALALYAGAHWAAIVQPAAHGKLVAMLVVAVAAGVTLDVARGVRDRRVRALAMTAVVAAGAGAILVTAGAPLGLLRPDRWGALATHVMGAIQDLPALRVPYTGEDLWIRAVLLSGGGLLLLAAAGLALRARPHRFGAVVCLGVLYAVPVVEQGPQRPWLDGAVLTVLLALSLWGDRLRRTEVPLAVAFGVAVLLAAVVTAPHLDRGAPWIDYESLAESLQSGSSTTFSWDHSYGPLHWPRTGVELARVRARGTLYFKTADLERFDGLRWRQARDAIGENGDTEVAPGHPDWRQTIHVDIRGLRTRQFLTAGTTTFVRHSSRPVHEATPGTFEVDRRPLRRGDSYDATVYVPQPTSAELRAAGTGYPSFVGRQLVVELPASRATGSYGPVAINFPAWGSGAAMTAGGRNGLVNVDPTAALADSPYRREALLARRLRRGASDPYDYVRRVIARVREGARYTETPPPAGRLAPLDAFLFRDHAGYCQHFAGATALLLRMGGVPARVASGFSPGSRGPDGERVIRDFDAHSWVEAYFPRIGWVTFDPTPSDSPARSQLTDRATGSAGASSAPAASSPRATTSSAPIPGQARGRDQVPGARAAGAPAAAGTDGGGGGISLMALAIGGMSAAAGWSALAVVRRRRRLRATGDPELAELQLALARTGRPQPPDVTLHRLERLLAGSDEARAYLRSLRLARYGAEAGAGAAGRRGPTPAQRRALRRELAAGLGVRGRMRALWALPPRPREVFEALGLRRRRPYTA